MYSFCRRPSPFEILAAFLHASNPGRIKKSKDYDDNIISTDQYPIQSRSLSTPYKAIRTSPTSISTNRHRLTKDLQKKKSASSFDFLPSFILFFLFVVWRCWSQNVGYVEHPGRYDSHMYSFPITLYCFAPLWFLLSRSDYVTDALFPPIRSGCKAWQLLILIASPVKKTREG